MNSTKTALAFTLLVVVMLGAFFVALHGQTSNPTPAPPQLPQLHSVWDGVYTEKQAQRGQALYDHLCSQCHGDKLMGKASEDMPALTGQNFEVDWNGRTVGDLFKQILRKMPQDDPGTLTPQQTADLAAFLLSFNKFPAGKAELPTDTAALASIRYETKKPDPLQGPGQPK